MKTTVSQILSNPLIHVVKRAEDGQNLSTLYNNTNAAVMNTKKPRTIFTTAATRDALHEDCPCMNNLEKSSGYEGHFPRSYANGPSCIFEDANLMFAGIKPISTSMNLQVNEAVVDNKNRIVQNKVTRNGSQMMPTPLHHALCGVCEFVPFGSLTNDVCASIELWFLFPGFCPPRSHADRV